jgi:LysR family transcriptional regulator, glycine cleavage system transcriptional activator
LPQWRKAHSRLKLEIVSTDEVVSLENGEADISIRYVRSTPKDGLSFELTRNKFHVVAAPKLVGKSRKLLNPVELARFPLIEAGWRSNDAEAPTWRQWEAAARKYHQHVPDLSGLVSLNFREELHAIEAAVSGQGSRFAATCWWLPNLRAEPS